MNRSRINSIRLSVQSLEDRSMPAIFIPHLPPISLPPTFVTASVSHGVLKVIGTSHADNILVSQANGQISVSGVNGSFAAGQIKRIEVFGLGGNDIIRLNSEATPGGQPILKPSIVQGGNGNDVIVGGRGNDTLLGDAGDDILFGNAGNDLLIGGAGKDRIYGGAGNDRIFGDLNDAYLAGESGTDVVKFEKVDPSPLAQGDPATLKMALQIALTGKKFSKAHNGEKITVSHLQVQAVSVVDGVTTVSIKAKIRYQKTQGFPQFSETGEIKFSFQPQLSATFVEGYLQNASMRLGEAQVQSVNLNNVPNWLDNSSEVRDFLTAKLQQQPPVPFTADLNAYLTAGGSLGPMIVA